MWFRGYFLAFLRLLGLSERDSDDLDLKIFVQPAAYTLHYRRGNDIAWADTARAEYAVLLVLAGRLEAGASLVAGDAMCFNPQQDAALSAHTAETLWLTLAPAFVLECAVRAGFSTQHSLVALKVEPMRQDARLMRLGQDLKEELAQRATGQAAYLAALVEQLMLHLLRHYAQLKRAPELELSRVGLVDRRIRRAVELLHARLAEDVSLEEMAAAAYLSPFHFARLFKKLTGTTPHAYLAGLRVAQAQKLLSGTDLSVTEIALRVGYTSPSHFTKAFRQSIGLTPRDFRAALIVG